MSVISKREKWINKKKRISFKIRKKLQRPRLIVFRSNKNIFLQLVDNISNNTMYSSSSIDKTLVKDISKAKNDLGYKPVIHWKEGVKRTVDWYKETFSNRTPEDVI